MRGTKGGAVNAVARGQLGLTLGHIDIEAAGIRLA